MKLLNKHFKQPVCLFPALLTTFLVACGGGGLDPILGSDANNTPTPIASTPGTTATPGAAGTTTNPPVVPGAPSTPVNTPNLGSAASFGVFGGAAGVTNQGVNTVVNGHLGTTAACTLNTGFHDATNVYTQTPLNVGGVNGSIYCAPPAPGTLTSMAVATQALSDIQSAYNTLAALPPGSDPGAGQLGGLVLAPAVYTAAGGSFNLTSGNLTLDGQGNSDAVWVFQSASSLTVGLSASPRSITLINGAQAKNVFWKVGSAARIEDGSSMVGTIIAPAGVTISTAGQAMQTTLVGRALSMTASVTMVNTTIVAP
ncbi:MAG: ice-binding family protein [Burkholderiaceae bacterium]